MSCTLGNRLYVIEEGGSYQPLVTSNLARSLFCVSFLALLQIIVFLPIQI